MTTTLEMSFEVDFIYLDTLMIQRTWVLEVVDQNPNIVNKFGYLSEDP